MPISSSSFRSNPLFSPLFSSAYLDSLPSNNSPPPSLLPPLPTMHPLKSSLTRLGMLAYLASLIASLMATLPPLKLASKLLRWDSPTLERRSLWTANYLSRTWLRLIPFARFSPISLAPPAANTSPTPTVWICNHQSMLDIFFMMAGDKALRGKHRRPIKVVYWQGLESNPVTKLLFKQCGFIPVAMSDNGAGEANEYDRASFKRLLKDAKRAFAEGFDIGILPEGQLNPDPETGLQPVFPGAFTLAKSGKAACEMMALSGTSDVWHCKRGMNPVARRVLYTRYGGGRKYGSSEELMETFKKVVGEMGTYRRDLPEEELRGWVEGEEWKKVLEGRGE